MTELTLAVIALLVLGWAVLGGALGRHSVTGPLLFTGLGFILANPDWGPLAVDVDASAIHVLAESTLALVLFSDASQVRLSELESDIGVPGRLLGLGLPLTLVLGGVLAAVMFEDLTWALAGYVGAALAPTDAALSVQVINDERVPARLRRALNVESGLNDGIATPLVTLAIALAASELGLVEESEAFVAGAALLGIALGVLVGGAAGYLTAKALNLGARRGWTGHGGRRIATFASAVAAFVVAGLVDGNGFIAAFVAGAAFAAGIDAETVDVEEAVELPELGSQVLALVVWFVYGATLLPMALERLSVVVVSYALISLTLLRMVPVALAMMGSRMRRREVLFLGWFGPRGLASVVFAVLALEDLGPAAGEAVAIVAFTVMLSVVLHGITARPAGRQFEDSERPRSEP
jgi:NhaP-type Na+/H+ or K+/H+ antiporter